MRRPTLATLVLSVVVLVCAVVGAAACATAIGLDKIQRVACVEDCGADGAPPPPGDGGADSSRVDTGSLGDVVLIDTGGDTAVGKCTAGGCDGGICDLDSGVCRALYTVGGTVSGLAMGDSVMLEDNGGNSLTVSANGAFVFTTPVAAGASYAVTVVTQPSNPMQACGIAGGTGTATADITSVTVTCVTNAYAIGGTVTGLGAGASLVLQDNGGDNLTLSANGPFMFATPIAAGKTYTVTVLTQPASPAQVCTVTSGSGTAMANVTGVVVTCVTTAFSVGGTLTGMSAGAQVTLQDNGGDNLTLTANGAFKFVTPVPSGSAYAVSVLTQPASPPQTCVISAGTGTVGSSNVTSVVVNCAINTFTVGGTVTGLAAGETITLQDNATDTLMVGTNGSFAFAMPLTPGSTYAVTLTASPGAPVDETCTVSNPSGTVANANVTNVAVVCAPLAFTIGGTVTGLTAGGTVVLEDNGGDAIQVGTTGPFTFPTAVASGQGYAVTVFSNPSSQFCAVTGGGQGLVANQNVATVSVACFDPPFASTGSNGLFAPTVNVSLAAGTYNYTTIAIPPGVTVTATGTGVLDLRASGSVVIGGTIDVSGSSGGPPQPCNTFPGGGGGGATGVAGYVPAFGTGDAGPGGPGGSGTVGATGEESPDSGASVGGIGGGFGGGGGGTVPTTGAGGGGGGGYAGGGGGSGGFLLGGAGAGSEGGGAGVSFWQGGLGGAFGGGGSYNGGNGQNGQLGNGASNGSVGGTTETGAGGGGGAISSAAATDLAVASTFQPGSGGGGGSGNYSSAGGGGGGGGGALRISGASIAVQGTASVLANGGSGAAGLLACNGTGPGGGGGGGSGGVVFLDAPVITVAGGAVVSAAGGGGAGSPGGGLAGGGGGGLGRIRLSLVPGASALGGVFSPPLQGGTAPADSAGFAYVAAFPN